MKNIILLVTMLFTLSSFSQDSRYSNLRMDRMELPCYVIANDSDTIGVLFSIPDVQKIDRNLEVLEYLEKKSTKIDTTMFYYVSLVGDLELKNTLLKSKIMNMISQDRIKDDMMIDLKSQIQILESQKSGLEKVNQINESIIGIKNKEIKKQKTLKGLFALAGVVAVIVTVVILGPTP